MEAVDVLVVGAGKIARRHAVAWKAVTSGGVAVTDVDPERARSLAEDLGVAAVEDASEAVALTPSQVVDVCVPTPYHAEYVRAGLEGRRHVFVEKPLCLTRAEARDIVALARASGRHVQVGYLFRHHPVFRQVKDWLVAGLIGAPHMALARMGGRGSAAPWKHNRAAGGGVVNEMVVHELDLLMWFLGEVEIERVHARHTLLPTRQIEGEEHEADAEDFILAELRAGSTRVFLQGDLATPTYVQNIEIHGANGSVVASVQEGFRSYLWLRDPRGEMPAGYSYVEPDPIDLFREELAAFAGQLHSPPDHGTLREAARQVEMLEELRGW